MTSKINVGAAGEHLVAAMLSAYGYHVGLVRGGTKAIDLLISDPAGHWSLPIQVKTASSARRNHKRVKHKDRWEWQVSVRAHLQISDQVMYAFVDLAGWPQKGKPPAVFWVPGQVVHDNIRAYRTLREQQGKKPPTQMFHWIMDAQGSHYQDVKRLHEVLKAVESPSAGKSNKQVFPLRARSEGVVAGFVG